MKDNFIGGEPLIILHVEDNPSHAELVKRSFDEHRVANKIYLVRDGETALDYLHQRGEYADATKNPMPHVILLDLRLPKIDGLDVLKEIRSTKKLKSLIVIILTTSADEMDIANAYEHHANSYLVKPLGFENFTELMKDLGFYWLGWNRHPLKK